MRPASRSILAAVLAAAVTACAASNALAVRPATRTERTLLIAAAGRSSYLPPRRDWATDRVRFTNLRISTVDARWATGTGHLGVGPNHSEDDQAGLLFHFVRGRWQLVSLGTSDVGCGVPKAVIKDLGGGWLTCVSGGN